MAPLTDTSWHPAHGPGSDWERVTARPEALHHRAIHRAAGEIIDMSGAQGAPRRLPDESDRAAVARWLDELDLPGLVRKGALVLDRDMQGWDRIVGLPVEMADACGCVLGQLAWELTGGDEDYRGVVAPPSERDDRLAPIAMSDNRAAGLGFVVGHGPLIAEDRFFDGDLSWCAERALWAALDELWEAVVADRQHHASEAHGDAV